MRVRVRLAITKPDERRQRMPKIQDWLADDAFRCELLSGYVNRLTPLSPAVAPKYVVMPKTCDFSEEYEGL